MSGVGLVRDGGLEAWGCIQVASDAVLERTDFQDE